MNQTTTESVSEQMRDVLGHFCSGITVITARTNSGPIGFTCQSFASLSIDPALVSFSPARSSTTWPAIRQVGVFAVNVLADDHIAASAAFSRSGTDKFAGVQWQPAPAGSPLLDGALAWAECRLWAEYDGGDHTIVAAQVTDLGAAPAKSPLLYYRGKYHLAQPAVTDDAPR
ncbi:flavin reductase family protein [Rhodococcus sp. IEGM 1381]|uniref:flavin reductase family protein n=1 Tax=Rhodococcus sp. IEGM 1381 TaxID=3047085 RepID=UPI0024B7D7C5|nr:flavin reductase family protein [Rhodococcus sp. IEGM 1381]MDI9894537.1 flavin reductase family protein [Rhodococcus sp. IEGM 1381]